MKAKKIPLSEQFQILIDKSNDRSVSWLGTGTSLNSRGVKPVLWALSYLSCKRTDVVMQIIQCIAYDNNK